METNFGKSLRKGPGDNTASIVGLPTEDRNRERSQGQQQSSFDLPNFEYQPLKQEAQEIRLIKVSSFSSSLDEGVTMTLAMEIVSLKNPPPFIALSYVWGKPEMIHPIACNGQRLLITTNLAKALRTVFTAVNTNNTEIFRRGENISLWADAICINQKNREEVATQIPLMKDIYSKSKGTLAYLGVPQDGSDPNDGFVAVALAFGAPIVRPDAKGVWKVPELNYDAYFQLFSQPFFNCSWIFQEMILPSRVLCLYGDERRFASWDLDMFLAFWTPFYTSITHFGPQRSTRIIEPSPRAGTLNLIYNILRAHALNLEAWRYLRRQRHLHPDGFDPILPLSHSRRAGASDARDMIYSISSLLSKEIRETLVVDYSPSNTVTKTFLDFAVSCIRLGFGISLLEQAGTSQQMHGLPSWVPNWATEVRYQPSTQFRSFTCAGSTQARISVSDYSAQLHISGWEMGKVCEVGIGLNYQDIIPISSQPQIQTLSQAVACLETNAYLWCKMLGDEEFHCFGSEDYTDVIWRTLWMDINWLGVRSKPTDRKYYEAWLAKYPRPEMETQAPRTTNDEVGDAKLFQLAASHMQGRILCLINGHNTLRIAALPIDAVCDDIIVVFTGGRVPFVLRPVEGSDDFQLVGSCYVHGVMDGELVDESGDEPSFFTGKAVRKFAVR